MTSFFHHNVVVNTIWIFLIFSFENHKMVFPASNVIYLHHKYIHFLQSAISYKVFKVTNIKNKTFLYNITDK